MVFQIFVSDVAVVVDAAVCLPPYALNHKQQVRGKNVHDLQCVDLLMHSISRSYTFLCITVS